ncbi:hypothetical protein AVI48_16360 (plasmid) [Piscirickettsia salmonis]|nr:hypothetical protein AVI48_16360 [Piscirickettsia salmonis]
MINYLDWLLNSKKRAQENNFSEVHYNFSQQYLRFPKEKAMPTIRPVKINHGKYQVKSKVIYLSLVAVMRFLSETLQQLPHNQAKVTTACYIPPV